MFSFSKINLRTYTNSSVKTLLQLWGNGENSHVKKGYFIDYLCIASMAWIGRRYTMVRETKLGFSKALSKVPEDDPGNEWSTYFIDSLSYTRF